MSHVHVVSICNQICTARTRCWKSTTFPADVTRLSPPFLRRESGVEAKGPELDMIVGEKYKMTEMVDYNLW